MSVIVKFLGTAQDGGIPQMECNCEICTDIRAGKRKENTSSCNWNRKCQNWK